MIKLNIDKKAIQVFDWGTPGKVLAEILWNYSMFWLPPTWLKISTVQLSLDVALLINHTAQKMKFSIKDFFSKFDQICSFLRIWSQLLKKSLMENLFFCAVSCSRVACMADFMLKNSERIIQTTILEHILNFSLHNFKTTRVQPSLGVCFFFMGCTGISPVIRFFAQFCWSRSIALLFLATIYFRQLFFCYSYGEAAVFLFQLYKLSWTTSPEKASCMFHCSLFQSHILRKFLIFWFG